MRSTGKEGLVRQAFETTQVTVAQLLSNEYVFEFPNYQRPYRWSTEHAEQLLEDVRKAWAAKKDDDYFMGSIVLAHSQPSARLVIDGRQRLTTLSILLAVLRDLESDTNTKSYLHQKLFDSAVANIRPERYRLRLSEEDDAFFVRHIGSLGATSNPIIDPDALPERQSNMAAVVGQFRASVSMMAAEERAQFAAFLLDQCVLISIRASTGEQGLRLFEILNSRGLELDEADLMKPILFDGATHQSREVISDAWEYADTLLGADGTNRLMHALCFILTRQWITASGSAANVLAEAIKQQGPDAFHQKVFPQYVDSFCQIVERSIPFSSDKTDPNRYVEALSWLGRHEREWGEWMPIALEILVRTFSDEKKRFELLKALERSFYVMFLNNVGEENRRSASGAILDDLRQGPDIALKGQLISPRPAINNAKSVLRSRLRGNVRTALTRRAEMALCESLGLKIPPNLAVATTEHILPRRPEANSRWRTDFPGDKVSLYLDLLGNATLLNKGVDGRIGRADFSAKKAAYMKHRTSTIYQLTKDVCSHEHWTPTEIAGRTERMAKLLERSWGI